MLETNSNEIDSIANNRNSRNGEDNNNEITNFFIRVFY